MTSPIPEENYTPEVFVPSPFENLQPATVQSVTPYTVSAEYQKLSINPTSVNMDYAPINNPTFTGTVTLPAVDDLSNDNTAATTSFCKTLVGNKITNLINSAPAALDTLNELAAALNNDASFGSVVTTSLANRYTNSENRRPAQHQAQHNSQHPHDSSDRPADNAPQHRQ
jgi:hypothetical protein